MQAAGADEIARRINGTGAQAAVSGSLEILLGRIANNLDRERQRRDQLYQLANVVPIMGALTGNGTIDYPDRYGPMDGFRWDVRRITISGFSAGTVTLYKNDASGSGVQLYQWTTTTPAEKVWSQQMWLAARDRLVFIAAGITGTVQIDGNAHNIAETMLSDYII